MTAPKTGTARVRFGAYHADLGREAYTWTRKASASDLFKPGDLVEVAITRLPDNAGGGDGLATVTLDQTPIVEGAMVVIENRTGQVKAMVGGWNFSRSKFNRAVQAYRQLGSTFKPIVYTTRSIVASRRHPSSSTRRYRIPQATARCTARRTTTTSSTVRLRCGGRSRNREIFRPSR
jgi:cell division protein FtsI/penicillin-binding protein 2